MAITGRFQADFSSFNAEVAKAETQLKGLEGQAQSAAVAADRIGASSSVATTGVTGLATATTAMATSETAAVAATAALDTALATETAALVGTTEATVAASAASGAYGSVLFATAEAEVAATTATVGFGTAVTTTAAGVVAGVAALAPLIAAHGIVTKYLVDYIEESEKAAAKAEAQAAKQDVINKALSEGAKAGISYAEAIKFVNEQDRHRLALIPEQAYKTYRKSLDDAAEAARRLGAEQEAAAQGGLANGEIIRQESDIVKQMADATKKATEEKKKHEEADKRAAEAAKRFSDSVKNLTTDAIGAAKGLGIYGALLPDLSSNTAQFADQTILLGSALDSTKKDVEALQRAGRFLSAAMVDVNQQLLKLPNVHSSLEGVDTAIHGTGDGLGELSRAFSELAQISDGAMSDIVRGLGEAISGINLATKAAEAFAKAGDNIAVSFASALSVISSMVSIGLTLGGIVADLLPGEGPTQKFIDQVEAAIAKAKELQQAAHDAAQAEADLLNEASSKYGPSQPELEATERHLHDLFDAMTKAGTYSADQLEAAYYAWQKAMAEAGNEAAKAWVKAHDEASKGAAAANAEMQKLIDRRDELTKSISQEAPEAEMGAIEKQMRAERDALDEQIKNAQTAADASADAQKDAADITKERWGDASKVLQDEMSRAGDDAASHIKDAFDFTIHIPIAFDTPSLPVVPMASGGMGRVTKPTLFYSKGNEDYAFSGEGQSFRSRASGAVNGDADQAIAGDIVFQVDGETFARISRQSVLNGGKGMREFRQMLVAAGAM